MLNSKEKRFIKYWQEQRRGGRWQYYLLYVLTGTFISTIILSFLTIMFLQRLGLNFLYIGIISLLLVTAITVVTWQQNEKKFKAIIKREIAEGEMADNGKNQGPSI